MGEITRYLPILIPVIILEFALMLIALIDLLKRTKVKVGNKAIWIIVILFVQIIGPISYFLIGRSDEG
ncbi:MAG: PLDc_N domain-containing protein [Clostridium sp.]|jgi:hypothetical protein|nr:PLDc_N domain-containing protein [Clostridium sp.]